jgi:hypothetical protein
MPGRTPLKSSSTFFASWRLCVRFLVSLRAATLRNYSRFLVEARFVRGQPSPGTGIVNRRRANQLPGATTSRSPTSGRMRSAAQDLPRMPNLSDC